MRFKQYLYVISLKLWISLNKWLISEEYCRDMRSSWKDNMKFWRKRLEQCFRCALNSETLDKGLSPDSLFNVLHGVVFGVLTFLIHGQHDTETNTLNVEVSVFSNTYPVFDYLQLNEVCFLTVHKRCYKIIFRIISRFNAEMNSIL